jgi:hypothetical protein
MLLLTFAPPEREIAAFPTPSSPTLPPSTSRWGQVATWDISPRAVAAQCAEMSGDLTRSTRAGRLGEAELLPCRWR